MSTSTSTRTIERESLLSPGEFAAWIGQSEAWVRARLGKMPGVIRESREVIRIHVGTYLDGRLAGGRGFKFQGSSFKSKKAVE